MAQRELVPIMVKIKLGPEGAIYPDFNQIDPAIRQNMDWSYFIDMHGVGWHYDQTSELREDTAESPYGEQWGMMVVPETFADAAVTLFPNEIDYVNEPEAEDFYNNKAHVKDPSEKVDNDALQAIVLREQLGEDLSVKKAKALDPLDPEPGVKKNKNKLWVDFKGSKNIKIKNKK